MKTQTIELLERHLNEFPFLRGTPASPDAISAAADAIGVEFPSDYRAFLQQFGAAVVGAYPIYGLTRIQGMGKRWSVVDVNRAFREDGWPGVSNWLIVSADLAGNPIGIDTDQVVKRSDHDFGGISAVARDFEEFLLRCLSQT